MEDKLIEILESVGYPVYLQGTLAESDYPDSFFTYWEDNSNGNFYSNKEISTIYEYSVNFYSTDQQKVYTAVKEAMKKLRQNKFALSGDGYSVPSGVDSHDGRGFDVMIIKNERNDT